MKSVGLLALITVSEATIGVFVKLVDGLIPIQTLNFYALALATAFLMIALPVTTGRRLRLPRGNVRDTAIIGVLIAAQISVFNFAMTLAPIANVVIFWSIAPFFTFTFSAVFLGERPRWSYILLFVVALAGIGLARPLEGGELTGNLMALGDGAIYAAMITYLRHEGKTEAGNDVAWSMLTAAVLLAPSLVLVGPGAVTAAIPRLMPAAQVPVLVAAVGLGVVSTGFAYLGISVVLKTLNANVYSLVDIIVSPIVASVLGILVFAEVPSPNVVYGGALLLAAGFWLSREMARGAESQTVHPCQCISPA